MISEFTDSLIGIYQENKGSILRTLIYTLGHFLIAITCLMIITNVSLRLAVTDAIVEPLANTVWYFILDKYWTSRVSVKQTID